MSFFDPHTGKTERWRKCGDFAVTTVCAVLAAFVIAEIVTHGMMWGVIVEQIAILPH